MSLDKLMMKKIWADPQWESEKLSRRPLRGPQASVIKALENIIAEKGGAYCVIMCSRQIGKNEMAAVLHRRHLWRNKSAPRVRSVIRTAPTYKPQIVNSKKRLKELLQCDFHWNIRHPAFRKGLKLSRSEGYIWQVGNATVEFLSSGPQSNVVGATATEYLDMDEAHKIEKNKFDEDFAPFTANTNAATLLWGVAADGMDTLEWYRRKNIEDGHPELNFVLPCDVWMEGNAAYRSHVEGRIRLLGEDHPIIMTQYKLKSVAKMGKFINASQADAFFDSNHERQTAPTPGCQYEMVIDVAGANEDFNPDDILSGNADTKTDSTAVWIYEVLNIRCSNGIFPVLLIRDLYWWTGAKLETQQEEIENLIRLWGPEKICIDGVGIGNQMAGTIEDDYHGVTNYVANSTSVSEDCFDLLARLNYASVKMFRDDGSEEYKEVVRQVGWTRYASKMGKMTLMKPKATEHIDLVKGLTYINRNNPDNSVHVILGVNSDDEESDD
jgi:hypothetical protein